MVGEGRRAVGRLARELGFSPTDTGRAELIVTEAATNLVKHAAGGELLLSATASPAAAIDIVTCDRGPGIANITEALRDGHWTAGTRGNGLGAIARLASTFDIYSRPGRGTAVFARVSPAPNNPRKEEFKVGGLNVPYPGEPVSGDCWAFERVDQRLCVLVADGLGHGPIAHQSAQVAEASFRRHARAAPAELVTRMHEALRATRGAALAVAEVDPTKRVVRFAGIGNIDGTIVSEGPPRHLVSHYGTAGHQVRRIQEFTYPWPKGGVLILHSDGLTTRWTLDDYPGLVAKHPVLAAAVLYRDFRRGRDDATVVVLAEAA